MNRVILTLLTGLINPGRTIYSIVFLYAFAANAFFLVNLLLLPSGGIDLTCSRQLRSLRSVVLPDLSSTATPVTVSHAQRKRRITFLFFEAVIQVVYMTILVRV